MDENLQDLTKRERRQMRREEKMHSKEKGQRNRLFKKIAWWIVGLAVVAGVIFGLVRLASHSGPAIEAGVLHTPVNASDWTQGTSTAKTVLVEYADFQCPACKAFYPIIKEMVQKYGNDNLRVAYRYFPLRQIHQNADLSARAAEAAGGQGKFWEMHDMLFDHQSDWAENSKAKDIFAQYAQNLALNVDQFKSDIDSDSIKDRVDKDFQDGLNNGIGATPTFFLNGKQLTNIQSFDDLRGQIESAIASSR